MYPRRWLVTLGLAAFLLGLLAHMPARLLLKAVPLERGGLVLQDASGTLLAGEARLRAGSGPLRLGWTLQPARLLMFQAALDWDAGFRDARAAGALGIAPWGRYLRVDRADVPAAVINTWLVRWRARVDQPLAARDLRLAFGPGDGVQEAAGLLAWGPGSLTVNERAPVAVPALRGRLARTDAGAELLIDGEREPGEPLARVVLDTVAGELGADVLQRGLQVLGQATGAPRPPDTVVFSLRQALGGAVDLSPAGR